MSSFSREEREAVFALVCGAVSAKEERSGDLNADVVAQALIMDMVGAGVPPGAAATLSQDQIVQAACDLEDALGGGNSTSRLPFGTQVASHRQGSIRIGDRIHVRRIGVPGLHAIEVTPRDAHGEVLNALRSRIYNIGSGTSCRRIGFPVPSVVGDRGWLRHVVEFPPLSEAGGAVLQHDVEEIGAARFCAASMHSVEPFARKMVSNAQWLWRRRVSVGQRVESVRQAARAGIAGTNWGVPIEIRKICIDARYIGRAREPRLIIEYTGFDDALRLGTLIDVVEGDETPEPAALWRAPILSVRRLHRARQLEKVRADGTIEALAAAVARAAPEGEAAVLLRLNRDLETVVTLPTPEGPFHANLFWRDGVIRVEAASAEGLALWRHDIDLEVWTGARREPPERWDLSSGVDFPLIREERRLGISPHMQFRAEPLLVNTATGAIWAEGPPTTAPSSARRI